MILRLQSTVWVSLSLAACAHTPLPAEADLPYIEVHSAEPQLVAHVASAAAYLETLAGCRIWAGVEQVPDGGVWQDYPARVRETHVWYVPLETIEEVSGKPYIGYANGRKVLLGDTLSGSDIQSLALHELGHTLGLVHQPDSGTIMDPRPLGSDWVFVDENQSRLEDLCGVR